jgi:hypothetical protein
MVAHRGTTGRRWHFQHLASTVSCSEETALHRAAAQAIVDGFNVANTSKQPYELRWTCDGCGEARAVDLTAFATSVARESSPVSGVITDVLFQGPRQLAVEVVVSHAPEPETLERYRGADVPVFIVEPTWDSISAFARGVDSSKTFFVRRSRCSGCQRQDELLAAQALELARYEAARTRELARIENALAAATSHKRVVTDPRPWTHDKRGNALRPYLQDRLRRLASKLTGAGFRQSQGKPWLFHLRVAGIGMFFADLGGTEEVPIWQDSAPLYYWDVDVADEYEELVVERIRSLLARGGVEVRTSFYSRY